MSEGSHTEVAPSLAPSTLDRGAPRSHPHADRSRQRDPGIAVRDGELLQEGSTANLIFGPAEVLAWLSRTITLQPGDIIATGTPAGVGAAQGRFLRDGDTVEVEVDGLGAVVNPVRSE